MTTTKGIIVLVLELDRLGASPAVSRLATERIREGLGGTGRGGATMADALWRDGELVAKRTLIIVGGVPDALSLFVLDTDEDCVGEDEAVPLGVAVDVGDVVSEEDIVDDCEGVGEPVDEIVAVLVIVDVPVGVDVFGAEAVDVVDALIDTEGDSVRDGLSVSAAEPVGEELDVTDGDCEPDIEDDDVDVGVSLVVDAIVIVNDAELVEEANGDGLAAGEDVPVIDED